jgi:hypothetical protein
MAKKYVLPIGTFIKGENGVYMDDTQLANRRIANLLTGKTPYLYQVPKDLNALLGRKSESARLSRIRG